MKYDVTFQLAEPRVKSAGPQRVSPWEEMSGHLDTGVFPGRQCAASKDAGESMFTYAYLQTGFHFPQCMHHLSFRSACGSHKGILLSVEIIQPGVSSYEMATTSSGTPGTRQEATVPPSGEHLFNYNTFTTDTTEC